tara:strand:+ start:3006 stop:3197 length:192 start_codon:yes stop_codon:yes gene_type:complete
MKTLRITTYWSPEEADSIYQLLDEFRTAIWQSYGHDIQKMHEEIRIEQQKYEEEHEVNDELPF